MSQNCWTSKSTTSIDLHCSFPFWMLEHQGKFSWYGFIIGHVFTNEFILSWLGCVIFGFPVQLFGTSSKKICNPSPVRHVFCCLERFDVLRTCNTLLCGCQANTSSSEHKLYRAFLHWLLSSHLLYELWLFCSFIYALNRLRIKPCFTIYLGFRYNDPRENPQRVSPLLNPLYHSLSLNNGWMIGKWWMTHLCPTKTIHKIGSQGESAIVVMSRPLKRGVIGTYCNQLGRCKVRSNLPYGGMNDGNYFVFLPVTGDGIRMGRWWCFTIFCWLKTLLNFSWFGLVLEKCGSGPRLCWSLDKLV